jgi:hypothetical protein
MNSSELTKFHQNLGCSVFFFSTDSELYRLGSSVWFRGVRGKGEGARDEKDAKIGDSLQGGSSMQSY